MTKRKIQAWGVWSKYFTIDDEATKGAVVGVNLFDIDGELINLEDFINESVPANGQGLNPAYSLYNHEHEGTAILSTGEAGGTKFLREDGDGTSSWASVPAAAASDDIRKITLMGF